jgi:hypothetical protein
MSFITPQQLMQAHGLYILPVSFFLSLIILRRWPVASHCKEQGEVCFSNKSAYPSLGYVTEGKAPGNAIFIQSVFRMSWG